jgi:hypothetical protein
VINRTVKDEITERIKIAGKWEKPKKGKICLLKSYKIPTSMYGAETWTWTKADINRLTAAEVRFLRHI